MKAGRVQFATLYLQAPAEWEATRTGSGATGRAWIHEAPDRTVDPQVFADLGLAPEQRLACFLYGGQPPGRWALRAECLPPGWACVVCAGGDPPGDAPLPHNFLLAPADAYTPDLARARAAQVLRLCGFQWCAGRVLCEGVFACMGTRGGNKHAQ